MHKIMLMTVVSLMISFSLYASDEHEAQMADMRKEIRELDSKTSEIQKNIEHTREKAAADSAAYEEYVRDHSQSIKALRAERDSLQLLVSELESKRNETEEQSEAVRLSGNNLQALAASITSDISVYCDDLVESLEPLAQFNIERQISALRFLSGEIEAGTVDAVEGMERYYQIVRKIESQAQLIEAWSGASPDSRLSGDVSFLRLGFVWLACVNADNTAALLWDEADSAWQPIDNITRMQSIRDAIALVNGKAAPHLIALPFDHTVIGKGAGDE